MEEKKVENEQVEKCRRLNKMFGIIRAVEDDLVAWLTVMVKHSVDICMCAEDEDQAIEEMIGVIRKHYAYEKEKANASEGFVYDNFD